MRLVATSALFAAVLVILLGAAVHRAYPHEIYDTWTMPGTNTSCCHNTDCRPVRAWKITDTQWVAMVDGQMVLIPNDKILEGPSPDGRSHWCGSLKMQSTFCFKAGEVRG